jgi:predicted short-subunit dehydrogenase-like oxidoreductase (DUF2520 family)
MTRSPNPPCSRLAIAGRGRVGNALAQAFRIAGIEVEGPLGRGQRPRADVVLLCVPDAEIATAAAAVAGARMVGHTSGATPLSALDGAGAPAFGLHPLQTVAACKAPFTGSDPVKGALQGQTLSGLLYTGLAASVFEGSGCAIAGSTPEALELARGLALAVGMEPFEIDDSARAAYHASASIASNFLVTLESMAERVAAAAGLAPADARRVLAPLVRQTVENWAALGPEDALTGPVARGDEMTVARQRRAIEQAAPDLLTAFDALVDATRALARAPRPADTGESSSTGAAA